MCGIAGGIGIAEGEARWMLAVQHHRGPDDFGLLVTETGLVGARRLSIIDVEAGNQPVTTADNKLAVVHNGEIYNYRDMRRELQTLGHSFQTRCDTEVILRAYEQWGMECVHRFRGMFAFAVYDARSVDAGQSSTPKLLLFRDRLGIKPLYYYTDDRGFLFASEVRALLASGRVERRLDRVALWEYLGCQAVPAPRTLIEGVRALLPGHWLEVSADGRVSEHRYWDLLQDASSETQPEDYSCVKRHVRDLLYESAKLNLVSDVPVGVFLSGGIDSSAVVGLIREATGQGPQTFSVGFADERFDERRFARVVAERFGTDHTEVLLTEDDLLQQLPEALAAMDQPSGDGVNSYVVARAVSDAGLKVAISGLGGDEVFGGYPSFERLVRTRWALDAWCKIPTFVRRAAARAAEAVGGGSVRGGKVAELLDGNGDMASAYLVARRLFSPGQRQRLCGSEVLQAGQGHAEIYGALLAESLMRKGSVGWYGWISYAESRTYMHDVLLRDTDQMGMANSVEVRVPLLDHLLAAYVVGLPDEVKRANGLPKRLLIESLAGLLPDEIVQRPKQGFTLPLERWMRGALRPFCEERLGDRGLAGRGILNPPAIAALWDRFLSGQAPKSWSRVWALVALEEWLANNGVAT